MRYCKATMAYALRKVTMKLKCYWCGRLMVYQWWYKLTVHQWGGGTPAVLGVQGLFLHFLNHCYTCLSSYLNKCFTCLFILTVDFYSLQ